MPLIGARARTGQGWEESDVLITAWLQAAHVEDEGGAPHRTDGAYRLGSATRGKRPVCKRSVLDFPGFGAIGRPGWARAGSACGSASQPRWGA